MKAMQILVLALGGGGGHIAASIAQGFARTMTLGGGEHHTRLFSASVRFLIADTNRASLQRIYEKLKDIPELQGMVGYLVLGPETAGGRGAGNDIGRARAALEESRFLLWEAIEACDVIFPVGTFGKATAMASLFPVSCLCRDLKKVVIPVVALPSFLNHEVPKSRYNRAREELGRFDEASFKLVLVLNDAVYTQPMSMEKAYDRINQPIARALRGLVSFLAFPVDIDINDLVRHILPGPGRLKIGSVILKDLNAGPIEEAVRDCLELPFYEFRGPAAGTLVCLQGPLTNLQIAMIRQKVAEQVIRGGGGSRGKGKVNTFFTPLHAFYGAFPPPPTLTIVASEVLPEGCLIPAVLWPDSEEIKLPASKFKRSGNFPSGITPQKPELVATPETPATNLPSDIGRQMADKVRREQNFPNFQALLNALNGGNPAALVRAEEAIESLPFAVPARQILWAFAVRRTELEKLSASWHRLILESLVEEVTSDNGDHGFDKNQLLQCAEFLQKQGEADPAILERLKPPESKKSGLTQLGRILGIT